MYACIFRIGTRVYFDFKPFLSFFSSNSQYHKFSQVLRGGDRVVDFTVKDGYGNTIEEIIYKSEGRMEYLAPETGM
jgi:hypothetical protein